MPLIPNSPKFFPLLLALQLFFVFKTYFQPLVPPDGHQTARSYFIIFVL